MLFGQDSTSYYPGQRGSTWLYNFNEVPMRANVAIIDDNVVIDDVTYYKVERRYPRGDIFYDYFRHDSTGDVITYDEKSAAECIKIPAVPEKGFSWMHADGNMKYTIIDTDATIKTPNGKHDNCLQIHQEQTKNSDNDRAKIYDLYFVKGKGLVATEANGKLLTYLVEFKL